ncbi:sigma-54 interaction domain-containing protein [Anaerostipes sp.]|uniref:sigma-54 interaction domain-containing protein n=1 Tax=Anaerostipes sp. TaxID=1872530 RepID=UPI0025BDB990|nr:sigma 54-interacting transcriptional regulator [Anaerostipes sp.]MBS7009883.1 sigma 54-interacting transcriptional regulator [Anaerostipes sp.]
MNSQRKELRIFSNVQEANERLDAIIEHSFDGIYITDGKANTIKVNQAYETLTGLRREDMIGKNMQELEEEKVISVSGSLTAIRENRVVTLQQEFETGKKAVITSSPIYGEDGQIIMVVTNVRDLTEIYHLKEEVGRREQEEEKLLQKLNHVQGDLFGSQMVAQDKNTLDALFWADKVSGLDATVMLLGETGVGKEEFARYIFQNSKRKGGSFIKVNCGAIPANLLESELFGYEKGAFTGANKNGKLGLFELADKGTIFLDEIGELPLDMQVKFLRVVQEQEIERVGGSRPVKIDVRIIAATNRDLEEMVKQKSFREDLFYRLMVFPIHIPPLRERRNDIEPLVQLFLKKLNKKYGFHKTFTFDALELLRDYQWPGNIRELKNLVERAVIISSDDLIGPESIPVYTGEKRETIEDRKKGEDKFIDLKSELHRIELRYMNHAYETYGNVRDAAASLGMAPSTFVRKRKQSMEEV